MRGADFFQIFKDVMETTAFNLKERHLRPKLCCIKLRVLFSNDDLGALHTFFVKGSSNR